MVALHDDFSVIRKQERKAELIAEVRAISDKAEQARRELTPTEARKVDDILDNQIPKLKAEIKRAEQLEREEIALFGGNPSSGDPMLVQADAPDDFGDEGHRPLAARPEHWVNGHGNATTAYAKGQPLAKPRRQDEISVGQWIQARMTGSTKHLPRGVRNAMSEGQDTLGGSLVPEEMSRQIIDLARNESKLFQAGMTVVPMESDTMTIARIESDPTFQTKAENAAFDEVDITFDHIRLNPQTMGTLVRASRELMADAPNFASLVETTLARALAVEIDRFCLYGPSTTTTKGIINDGSIGKTTSVGGIAWEDLATGVVGIKTANEMPNAYFCNSVIAGDLDALTTGDGTNAAKGWLSPPPNVAPLTRYETNNMETSELLIGDFTKAIFGARLDMEIDMSPYASDTFEKYQVMFRIVTRFDVNIMRAGAFHLLDDVTS